MLKTMTTAAFLSAAAAFRPATIRMATMRIARRGFKSTTPSMIAVGEKFPSVEIDYMFPPTKVNMAERLAGKKTIVVGLPGAFTPT